MEKIGSYILQEKIREAKNTVVYRGYKQGEKQQYLITLLKSTSATPAEIAQFKQEYDLIKNCAHRGIVRMLDLLPYEDGWAMIQENVDGLPLKNFLEQKNPFPLSSLLKLAADAAATLGALHLAGIIHRAVTPLNLVIDPVTEEVKLTRFGVCALVTHENDEVYNPTFIQNTLLYMSPEQTGRMNRSVDYRTDLYSLGVTLYEAFTGLPPFFSHDPLDLIHAHIAIPPKPPAQIKPDLPSMVSDIILRLLAKNPEERYQNGFGLEADLQNCLRLLEETCRIEPFELGRHDISNRFIIPQKLFGREKEIRKLVASFEDVASREKGISVMVVTGAPGIGKSAVVHEIHKPIVAKKGYFISGKYEQFRRDKPYSAIIQAFQVLVKQILAESETKIKSWKDNLLKALGPNGKVITDVIAEVEWIIGPQPELPELGPEESKNRFNFVFEKFMKVFPQKEHPVALFLDDLQWADPASLQLIKNIMLGDIHYLFLFFSYRDNEVDENHPIENLLAEAQKNNVKVNRITLEPLQVKDVADLIVNFLHCPRTKGEELAALIQKKAGGNPFFVNQFLHTLYNEKMIVYEASRGWQWDAAKISCMQVADNLVEMLAGKIGKLSPNTQEVLKMCSCIGNRFDLETLAAVRNSSVEKALEDLTEAIGEGMISRVGDYYAFHHDRIQEAAYSLVGDAEKPALHYRIGKLTLETTPLGELSGKLFYIVDQFNNGIEMIRDDQERLKLVSLNLQAGKKAKASAAYAPAFQYLQKGIELLGKNAWDNHYDVALDLYTESTEAAYLMGDYDKMNTMADVALKHARTLLEKIRIFTSQINARIAREDYQGAIDVAMPIMKIITPKFGVRVPRRTTKLHLAVEVIRTLMKLVGKKPQDLLNLPKATDPEILASGKILASVGHAAFYVDPNLLALIILKSFRLMFKYGLAPEHAFALAGFGLVMVAGLWNINTGVEYGKLGLTMLDKLNAPDQACRTLFTYNALVRHWKYPMKDSIEPMLEGYRLGLETGDLGFATFNLYFTEVHHIFTGMELSELEKYMEKNNKGIAGLKQGHTLTLQSLTWQAILNLLGRCENPIEIKGKASDGEKLLPEWEAAENLAALSVYWFVKLILCSLFGRYDLALEASDQFKKYKNSQQGVLINKYAVLLDSVARLMTYQDATLPQKIKHRFLLKINELKMSLWAKKAPMNCSYMYQSMRALRTWCVQQNLQKAEKLYNDVFKLCRRYGNFIVEGIAADIVTGLYLAIGEQEKAREQFDNAYRCYKQWGAVGLIDKLCRSYPAFAPTRQKNAPGKVAVKTGPAGGDLSQALDLSTVMQLSEAISGEIMLEKLLQKIMHISLTNAGAHRGFLLLESEGKLIIEAGESVDEGGPDTTLPLLLQDYPDICHAIVNYVHHTGRDVILGNASEEGPFMDDPYITRTRSKSILCTPIAYKGKLSGILYMENHLTVDAFTPERLQLLKVICAQAATSIENARLFELATTLENIQDGYFEIDLAGNYTFFNNAVCEIHGYTKDELLGMNNRQYSDSETAKKVYQAFNQVYKTGQPLKGLEWQIIRKDGTRRYVETSVLLQKDASGKPMGFRGIVRDITDRKEIEEKLQQTLESLSKAYDSTLQVMVSAVEIRDPYTALHQVRSADMARDIAIEMGLNQEQIDAIRMAGAIHDIGKLSLPPEILTKPTKLTPVEFALVKEHSRSGYEILKNVESPWPLAQIVHQHHERLDGSGYPRSLKGDQILLEARVLAVADVVSAMMSHRMHRPALGIEAALEEIQKNKGILYDADVCDACLRLFKEKGYKLT